ncbi:MAG: hypothetical protein LUH48_05655 [Clostridiales bacterium]|nr:hypothetical protein [Clostridiales bacterium]
MKRFVSKLTACLMACLMLCTMLPTAFAAEDAAAALSGDGGTLADGSYVLEDDVTLAEDLTIPSGVEVTIDLNGHTLTGTGTGRTITVAGTLTLNDSSDAQTGTITGGGVLAEGASSTEKATFTMNGGTITGSDVGTTGSGGGVYVRYCNFTMNGGLITGNAANYGAGVYIRSYSTFVMNGGTITGNTAYDYGGGVEVNAGSSSALKSTFTLNDGVITGNSARIGGGIYLYGYGYLVMNGGSVYNNSSSVSGADIAVASKGHATLNSTEQFDGSLTLTDCGHTITGWYDDSRDSRWSETNCTAVDTSAELVSAYYLKAAHGIIKTSEPGIAKTADVTSASAGGQRQLHSDLHRPRGPEELHRLLRPGDRAGHRHREPGRGREQLHPDLRGQYGRCPDPGRQLHHREAGGQHPGHQLLHRDLR